MSKVNLTRAQIAHIKELRGNGMSYVEIAEQYPFSRETVRQVCLGSIKAIDDTQIQISGEEALADLIRAAKAMRQATKKALNSGMTLAQIKILYNEIGTH